MALGRSRARGRERGVDYWPGFVDALSTLLLVFIFLLAVFMLGQFFIGRDLASKDDALTRLTRRISELTELLSLEKGGKVEAEQRILALSATLQTERATRLGLEAQLGATGVESQRVGELTRVLESEKAITASALREVELLNQQLSALRTQLQALENALAATEAREQATQTRLTDLGTRLNLALAQRVQELNRYRSDFFGRLRGILGTRPDIREVGDRFVFQSEIFFASGAAELEPSGRAELDTLASALVELERTIPPDLPWVARIDGHTDKRPLSGLGQFKDNWELSTARALAVVRYLASKGVSPQRLVAAGFGEFAPLDFGDAPEALARNRRLELKITER